MTSAIIFQYALNYFDYTEIYLNSEQFSGSSR